MIAWLQFKNKLRPKLNKKCLVTSQQKVTGYKSTRSDRLQFKKETGYSSRKSDWSLFHRKWLFTDLQNVTGCSSTKSEQSYNTFKKKLSFAGGGMLPDNIYPKMSRISERRTKFNSSLSQD